jgi:hypothetical protein
MFGTPWFCLPSIFMLQKLTIYLLGQLTIYVDELKEMVTILSLVEPLQVDPEAMVSLK